MSRTCLFDLGNVLVFFSHDRMCRQIAELFGVESATVRSLLIGTELQHDFECGRISEAEFHGWLVQKLGRDVPLEQLLHAASDIFRLNDDMVPVLQRLRSSGTRLVLLSNTCVSHIRFIERHFDVLDFFDDLVLSCDVGAIKPEAAIYRAALDAVGCPPENCFFTDDLEANIAAARSFGIPAEVFTDAKTTSEELVRRGFLDP